jgi:hypothetical protein
MNGRRLRSLKWRQSSPNNLHDVNKLRISTDLQSLFSRIKPDFDPTIPEARAAWQASCNEPAPARTEASNRRPTTRRTEMTGKDDAKGHGHFSAGQDKGPSHAPDKERVGHFSEGQEETHDEGAHGHFSEGQEREREHTHSKEHEGSFGEGQRKRRAGRAGTSEE